MRPLVLILLVAACDKGTGSGASEPADKPEKPMKLAGVFPSDWKCESIASLAELGTVLGGTVEVLPSASAVPRGVPAPCGYQVTPANAAPEPWTFDIDCRPDYKRTADALFAQYTQGSEDLVAAYKAAADAGIKPSDAGIEIRPPEPAAAVDVGAKGLDHHGRGLIFIDDDAPCYVRVLGTDGARRLELAKLVAKKLTFANAPMSPRPFP